MTYTGVVLCPKSGFKKKNAYTGVDFSLKSDFTKIVLTPGLPLRYSECAGVHIQRAVYRYSNIFHHLFGQESQRAP